MKRLPAFLSVLLFSVAAAAQQNSNTTNAKEMVPPFSFEQLRLVYDTLIPIFDGLFITHYRHDKNAPLHVDEIFLRGKVPKGTHKWGVVDSSGNIVVPFICDGVKAIDRNKGIASVYSGSYSLNTGVPRYRYNGKYFYFTKAGRTEEAEKAFGITVVFVSDWHFEEFVILSGPEFYLPDVYRDKKIRRY